MTLFSISFIAGTLLGLCFFPRLADLAGRKTVYYLGVLLHVMLVATSFLVQNDSLFYGLVFFMGLEQVARFTVGYVYLSEFCCDKFQRPFVTTLALFISAESAMVCAIYFKSIGKRWEYFELVGLIMSVISLLSVCMIPESPRWLISRGKFKRAFEVYKKIAKFNGVLFTDMIWKLSRDKVSDEIGK
jgi:putative MFS transporter